MEGENSLKDDLIFSSVQNTQPGFSKQGKQIVTDTTTNKTEEPRDTWRTRNHLASLRPAVIFAEMNIFLIETRAKGRKWIHPERGNMFERANLKCSSVRDSIAYTQEWITKEIIWKLN